MKLTRKILRGLIKEEYRLLLEQEPEPEEEALEDEALEDEDVGGEEEAEAAGDEAEDEGEVAEEEVEPPGEEDLTLAKSVDDELNALFVDFETDAIQAAKLPATVESHRYSLAHLLFEQEETPIIDMETFASDVARLVQNYDSLLDMKAIIVKKAQDYIQRNYDEAQASALMDILDVRYNISLDIPEDMISPMAVGASSTAAEGGA